MLASGSVSKPKQVSRAASGPGARRQENPALVRNTIEASTSPVWLIGKALSRVSRFFCSAATFLVSASCFFASFFSAWPLVRQAQSNGTAISRTNHGTHRERSADETARTRSSVRDCFREKLHLKCAYRNNTKPHAFFSPLPSRRRS